jgi:hypothetical protein
MVSGLYDAIHKQCCGSGMFIPDPGSEFFQSRIPDPNFFHPGSRICIKEFKYINPKKWFITSRKYDPGCSSRIRILIFNPSRIPGSKKGTGIPDPQHWHPKVQKGTGSRIRNTGIQGSKRHRIQDPQHWYPGVKKAPDAGSATHW